MALTKALGDSNAAKAGADMAAQSGDPAMLGYTKVPFPSQEPAKSNADVGITSGSKFVDQQGTSLGAYHHQPAKPDAKTGQ
jgi:hypothetical protein